MRRAKWYSAVAGLLLVAFFVQGGVGFASTSTLTSASGAFTIAVPRGFHNDTAALAGGAIRFEVVVAGSSEKGFAVNINVVRERTGVASVSTLAQGSMIELKHVNGAYDFSTVQRLTVAGAPARAFDYLASFGGARLLHERQVYAIHDGWAYVVTYAALPGTQYQQSFSALGECLTTWHWR
jgi:hypothetical protein